METATVTTDQISALRFLPFLAEAAVVIGTSWLLNRKTAPPPNFGGRYLRALLASIASLPIALVVIFSLGVLLSLIPRPHDQPPFLTGNDLALFMIGTLGRTLLVWPFLMAWLVFKPHPINKISTATPTSTTQEPEVLELGSGVMVTSTRQADLSTAQDESPARKEASDVKLRGKLKTALVLAAAVAGAVATALLFSPSTAPAFKTQAAAGESALPIPQTESQWEYRQTTNAMTGEVTRYATVSNETDNLRMHAWLKLRQSPELGNAFLVSTVGWRPCLAMESCNILVRFDDAPPVTYAVLEKAGDLSISEQSRFLTELKAAKRIRISDEGYVHGAPFLEFDVTGFDERMFLASPK